MSRPLRDMLQIVELWYIEVRLPNGAVIEWYETGEPTEAHYDDRMTATRKGWAIIMGSNLETRVGASDMAHAHRLLAILQNMNGSELKRMFAPRKPENQLPLGVRS